MPINNNLTVFISFLYGLSVPVNFVSNLDSCLRHSGYASNLSSINYWLNYLVEIYSKEKALNNKRFCKGKLYVKLGYRACREVNREFLRVSTPYYFRS